MVLLCCLFANAQQPRFRVIGYLRLDNIVSGDADKVDYSKITHLNIAFINPDSGGNFLLIKGLKRFVDEVHQFHVKVFASIGGGLAPAYYSNLLTDANRPTLIKNLARLTELYDLDGIDVDLEGERIDANYENFILEVSSVLRPKSKLLTAAVATVYKARYTDRALAQFDFINIMSYDKTGPWRPEKPGPHAPYEMAVEDIEYWAGAKAIAKDKLSLGIPFYGYGFGSKVPADMSFRGIINKYSGAEKTDSVSVSGGGTLYYNGISTIQNKTRLALQKAGGIMIWQLLQDTTGPNSLLKAVNDIIISQNR
jgi:GH18 family chitinase